jgi:hypothetical protein
MTSETKHFVELSDIVALRLKCRHCQAGLHVTLNELPQPGVLSTCPNCRRPWATVSRNQLASHDYEREIVGFMDVILETKKITAEQFGMGFSLTLEVKNAE